MLIMSHSTKNSKSILAKALAAENITVEHNPNATTAMFDIANRILVLPVWEKTSDEVYDLLVGHEVGHALFTPDIDAGKNSSGPWTCDAERIGGNVHASYVQGIMNIVEDVRIERMVKDKFPGLKRDFSIGYRELLDKNFFGTQGRDLSTLSFPDRLNLHFKVGVHLAIPFSAEEQDFVSRIESASSFDQVLQLTEDIFSFIGGSRQHIELPEDSQGSAPASGDGSGENGNPFSNGLNENNEDGKNGNSTLSQMITQDSFNKQMESMAKTSVRTVAYTTLPTPILENIIVPYKTTQTDLTNEFRAYENRYGSKEVMEKIRGNYYQSTYTAIELGEDFPARCLTNSDYKSWAFHAAFA